MLSIFQLVVIGVFTIIVLFLSRKSNGKKSALKELKSKKLNELSPNEVMKIISEYTKILENINGLFLDEKKLPRPKEEMFGILKLGYVILTNLPEDEVLKIYPIVKSKTQLLELMIANTGSLSCFVEQFTATNFSNADEILDGATGSKNISGHILESLNKMKEERKYYTEQMRILEKDLKEKAK